MGELESSCRWDACFAICTWEKLMNCKEETGPRQSLDPPSSSRFLQSIGQSRIQTARVISRERWIVWAPCNESPCAGPRHGRRKSIAKSGERVRAGWRILGQEIAG